MISDKTIQITLNQND